MNLVDFYILPHYKSKEKYTNLADEIEKDYIIVYNTNNYKIIETE